MRINTYPHDFRRASTNQHVGNHHLRRCAEWQVMAGSTHWVKRHKAVIARAAVFRTAAYRLSGELTLSAMSGHSPVPDSAFVVTVRIDRFFRVLVAERHRDFEANSLPYARRARDQLVAGLCSYESQR